MGKKLWGNRPRINFILKKPDDRRRTFQVLKRTVREGQKPTHEAVDNERIRAINASLLNGIQDAATCEIQVREIMAELQAIERRHIPRIVHNEENARILEAYWEREYASRNLSDPQAARNRLFRSVEAVGSLSLFSASRESLQKAVDKKYRDNRQRDIIAALNQILRSIGRPIELVKRKEIVSDVHYLTPEEFADAQSYVENPIDRLLQSVGFHTGLRIGEIFALTPEGVQGAQFFTQFQIDRQLDKRATKRGSAKRRKIYVLPGGEALVREWARLPMREKLKYRSRKHAEVLKAACVKAFPDQTDKHIVFHDLRHSYAVFLVSRGVSISQVAQCLNNSAAVCERYYSGFVLKDETIESIKRIIETSADPNNASVAK